MIAALLLASPAAAADRREACLQRNAGAPARWAGVVRALCSELHNLEGVGAGVAIAEAGAVFTATAGEACAGGAAVTPATRFRAGSLTKLATAALALRMVEAGRLGLDAPGAVPELAEGDERAGQITLRQLLQHTSGLGELEPRTAGADWLAALGGGALATAPGTLWRYSNAGYAAVGAALERAGGAGYAELLAREVLAPLGIAGSADPRAVADAACGHLGRGARALALDVVADLEVGAGGAAWTAAAGGLIASPEELVRLALGVTDPLRSPLSAPAIAAMLAAEVPTDERPGERYGLGVRALPLTDGTTVYAHAGDTGDFAADLVFAPDRGFALAVMHNGGAHLRATLAAGLQAGLGATPAAPAEARAPAFYAGRYAAGDGDVVVTAEGGLAIVGRGALEHVGDHRFRVTGEASTWTFVIRDGAPRWLRGRGWVGARRE